MPEKRKIYFHIGAHKTASSFLQANLRTHQDAISCAGLDVILRQEILKTPFAKELGDVAHGRRSPNIVSSKSSKNIRKILSRKKGNVLIANEDLISSLKVQDFYQNIENSVSYICKILPDFDVYFVLYIRRQADYLESVYMQYVHLGRNLKFDRFMKRTEDVDFSWLRVVEGIASGVPQKHIIVRPFETIREIGSDDFFREFLSLCGVENTERFEAQKEASTGRAANRSYGELGMKIARQVNPMLNEQERKLLRRFLQEYFSTATHPRAVLFSPEARARIFEEYASSNRRLFEQYDLGGSGHTFGYY